MQKVFRKPLAVLLSLVMVLTAFSAGFVVPAFAVDTTALDAAVADANALTAANYVDFSGVTAAVNAAADTTGKTQTQIDDMEDAIRIAIAKLELNTKYTPQTIISETAYVEGNVVYVYGAVTMPGAFSGQSAPSGFRFYWDGSICYHTCQTADEVIANYTIDRYKYSNMSQLGEFISLNYGTAGYRHRYNVFLDQIRTSIIQEPGWNCAGKGAYFTSAKGQTLYYEMNKGPGLLTANENTDYVTGQAQFSLSYTAGINGALPAAGDSVQFRVVANPMCTTLQDSHWFIGGAYVVVNLYAFDTTNLRSAMAFAAAPKSNYTAESYAAYRTALDAATPILNKGNPTQEEIDAATTALNNAINGLQSVITIDGNGGTASPETLTLTFGSNSTVAFPANEVTATRAGYDFAGWDKDIVTYNDTVTASWTVRHDTAYTVNHYYMESDGSYPSAPQAQTLIGTTEDVITAADCAVVPAKYTLDATLSDESVEILGDGSAVLNLYYKLDEYTVTFSIDGTETSADYCYGAVPAYDGETPTLTGTDEFTYTFLGWTADAAAEPGAVVTFYTTLPAVTGDATYYPYFGAAVNSYDITFRVDGVDTTASFPYGATPAYDGIPAKEADAQYTYTFSGWDPEIAAVTGEATYTAQFDSTLRQYPVFVNGGIGSVIDLASGMRDYGTVLEFTVTVDEAYSDSEPTVTVGEATIEGVKSGNVFSYSTTVTGNTEISVSDLAKNTYTITFTVDGTETEATVAYGETPAYDGTPSKAADDENYYVFTGWDPALAPATEDAEYTAQFDTVPFPAHEHNFATFVRTVAATCVAGGYDEYVCECGMTEQRNPTAVNAGNHAMSAITVGAREATETEDGYSGDLVCPACGVTITEGSVIPKTGSETPAPHEHDFAYVRTVAATCCEKGYDEYACACGMTEKRNETAAVDADNHAGTMLTVGAREATETADGYTGDTVCSACGRTLTTGTVIPKTGTEPTEPTEPTDPEEPTEPGEPTVYETGCPYCGKTHDGTFIDRLLGLIHTFLHVVRTLFKVVPKS